MLKRILNQFLRLFIIMLVWACGEESNPVFDEQSFTSIFDNSQFSSSYFPIDVQQTSDGGYLILGGRKIDDPNSRGIYILKVDKYGNFVKDLAVDETYINPVAQFSKLDNSYYFFCMETGTLRTHLATVEEDADTVMMTPLSSDVSYPAVASLDNNNFLLLSYDNANKQSVVSVINAAGSISASKGYGIGAGDNVEEPIISHFIRTGPQLPFQVGKVAGGSYYFNGFYNYTFSLAFVDLNQDDPGGVVQGQQDESGFSAVTSISGNKFATARFSFGDNYLLPNVTLATSGISSSVDLGGNTLPELVDNANVKILRATIDSKNVLIYGSDTRSKQIGLFFYDEATGEFFGSQYLGFSNPFTIANLIQTADGGLAVCGTTYLAGRFPRICLFKISSEELAKNIK